MKKNQSATGQIAVMQRIARIILKVLKRTHHCEINLKGGSSPRKEKAMEGNQQKMREAVVALLDAMESLGCDEDTDTLAAFVSGMEDSSAKCLAAFRKAKDALAAPPRNCDVGTAEEQSARYDEFCYQHRTIEHCCANCPIVKYANCELAWAQMQYEEEQKGEVNEKVEAKHNRAQGVSEKAHGRVRERYCRSTEATRLFLLQDPARSVF